MGDIAKQDLGALADKLIHQQWYYFENDALLLLKLGDSHALQEFDVIIDGNNLHPDFKQMIHNALNKENLLADLEGPFGDDDIFSGADEEGITTYYIELYNVTPEKLQQIKDGLDLKITLKD